jgi:hypothetical protein
VGAGTQARSETASLRRALEQARIMRESRRQRSAREQTRVEGSALMRNEMEAARIRPKCSNDRAGRSRRCSVRLVLEAAGLEARPGEPDAAGIVGVTDCFWLIRVQPGWKRAVEQHCQRTCWRLCSSGNRP